MDYGEVEVLLVEDNPYDAELTIIALRRARLANRVHHVRDGAEALALILGEGDDSGRGGGVAPRLILLDLKLPKIDGEEVLRRIKADERTKCLPVVVLTSSQEERDIIEAYRLGVNSYIVKPVDFDRFMKAISDVGYYWLLLNRPLP